MELNSGLEGLGVSVWGAQAAWTFEGAGWLALGTGAALSLEPFVVESEGRARWVSELESLLSSPGTLDLQS